MYIVNTSFFVDPSVQNVWLGIMKDKFLPFLEERQCSIVSFARVLSEGPVDQFIYSLLTEAGDTDTYRCYVDELLAEYERLAHAMFGEKVTTFTTLMKKIDRR